MIVSRDRCAVGLIDPPDVLCVVVQSTQADNQADSGRSKQQPGGKKKQPGRKKKQQGRKKKWSGEEADEEALFHQSDAAPGSIILSATERMLVPVAHKAVG